MSKSMPSLLALLGLVAVAGYQNRGKLSEMISGAQGAGGQNSGQGNASSDVFADARGTFGADTGGQSLSDGLSQLMDRFTGTGQGSAAQSWVADGPNEPIQPASIGDAIGDDTLAELGQKTGLSRDEILSRLSSALPDVVNQMTPRGRLPSGSEARDLI